MGLTVSIHDVPLSSSIEPCTNPLIVSATNISVKPMMSSQ